MENAEINNVVKIMGLQFKEKYDDPDKIKSLRYGKLMIMTDQDQDGSHIKGLLINFIHHFWPNLLKRNVVVEFITPIVKVCRLFRLRNFLCTKMSYKLYITNVMVPSVNHFCPLIHCCLIHCLTIPLYHLQSDQVVSGTIIFSEYKTSQSIIITQVLYF